jgi:hypothetical protein
MRCVISPRIDRKVNQSQTLTGHSRSGLLRFLFTENTMSTKSKLPVLGERYTLVEPSGSILEFSTLPEVIAHMDDTNRTFKNPYAGHADEMEIWTTLGRCYPVVQRSSNFGIKMSIEDGDATYIVNKLFEQVKPFSIEFGKAKQPWQMTRLQWNAVHCIGSMAYRVTPCLSEEHYARPYVRSNGETMHVADFIRAEFYERYGYGHNGPVYDGRQTNSRHEVHVEYALAQNLPVPDEVIDHYLAQATELRHKGSFAQLLKKPYLRGLLSADWLKCLVSLLDRNVGGATELTQDNADYITGLVKSLPEPSYQQIEDLLFDLGVLKKLPSPQYPKPEMGKPVDAFARVHRDLLAKMMAEDSQQKVLEDQAKYHLTKRDLLYKAEEIAAIPDAVTYAFSNKLAQAIVAKDLPFLLSILDQSGNEASKRAVCTVYGIKLNGVKAKDRRRGIFTLAGYVTEAQYLDAETALSQNKREQAEKAAEKKERRRQETLL